MTSCPGWRRWRGPGWPTQLSSQTGNPLRGVWRKPFIFKNAGDAGGQSCWVCHSTRSGPLLII